ncbi:hypothetical protein JMJ58_19595 [Haloterrigena salifodinae]|uniref:Uncharacterized protein n=1 Tax=Haloterrigena salifodinae TaxID=2675099 RepID=A0A8T8E0U5_9EURY|nr:hypothetical protein [Haloterrigena salifodinae]QRV15086.1 hypothetical protein JMJ58_19595 [Haloterrigena salifodinae]
MTEVYVVYRSIAYEDTDVLAVFDEPRPAKMFARGEADDDDRWGLPIEEWTTDDPDHFGSYQCGDATWVVRRFPVQ